MTISAIRRIATASEGSGYDRSGISEMKKSENVLDLGEIYPRQSFWYYVSKVARALKTVTLMQLCPLALVCTQW